jgi:ATP-binding cassette subfamily F protein 3
MALVTTHRLCKSFGGLAVFAGLDLIVPEGSRIAIVGPNGIGKTTLLRVIAGAEAQSAGTIHRAKGLTIGYLPQETIVQSGKTLWDECLLPFAGLLEQRDNLARLETEMSAPATAHDALDVYGTLQARFEQAGGYTYEIRLRQVLGGLGFSRDDYDTPLDHLSGGQRTRALLAQLLLEAPNLLILDEPTNHLDTEAVEWLESYIKDWQGAAIVVSHDRYLLDRVCNNIWEMSGAGFEAYRGNYSHYLRQRQERWQLRSKEFQAEKLRLSREMDYIKRNITAANVAQARGRLRRLSRQIQAIEQIGLDAMRGKSWLEISEDARISAGAMNVEEAERRLKALRNPLQRPRQLKFKLKAAQRGGDIVLSTGGITVGYPGKKLFEAPAFALGRSACAALIGPNGSGKTTFLRTILGKIPPLAGRVTLGTSLDVGYFAQAREDLDPRKTLVEEIGSAAPHMLLQDIRDYLARYLFSGEDVFKRVEVLSGGERGRLALAKLALRDSNVLLLDEPTNHLDIPSQEMLQNILAEFEGTIILVSHDRYLIDALATQVWEIDKHEKVLRVIEATYGEYRASREASGPAPAGRPDSTTGPAGDDGRAPKREAYRKARQAKNREIAEERRRQARLAEVRARIAVLEDDLTQLGRTLANPPNDRAAIQSAGEEYLRAESELEVLLEELETLQ